MRRKHATVTRDLSLVCVEAHRYTTLCKPVDDSIVHVPFEIYSLFGVSCRPKALQAFRNNHYAKYNLTKNSD